MRRCYQLTTSSAVRVFRACGPGLSRSMRSMARSGRHLLCTGTAAVALALLPAPDAAPALRHALALSTAHAETDEEAASRERLEAHRIARFKETQWDVFLKALKAKDIAGLKPMLTLPITYGEQKLETPRDFVAVASTPRVLRGVNRAKMSATDTGFVVEWKGDGANKYTQYQMTFNQSENQPGIYVVTAWTKWQISY